MITKQGSFRRSVVAFILGAMTCFWASSIIAKTSGETELQSRSEQACLYASKNVLLGDIVKVDDDIYIQCVADDQGSIFKKVDVQDAEILQPADRKILQGT